VPINGLKRNPSYLLLDSSQDSIIVILAAFWTKSTQLSILVTPDQTGHVCNQLLNYLNVKHFESIELALEYIDKEVVGAVTDFSNRCTQFARLHPHP